MPIHFIFYNDTQFREVLEAKSIPTGIYDGWIDANGVEHYAYLREVDTEGERGNFEHLVPGVDFSNLKYSYYAGVISVEFND